MSTTLIEKHTIKYASGANPRSITLINGLDSIGTLLFYPNGAALPKDMTVKGHVMLYYYREDFANILNLLKTEKPVYLVYTGPGMIGENGLVSKDPSAPEQPEKNVVKSKRTK